MNFSSRKSKISIGYFVLLIMFFVIFYIFDDMAFARFLGYSAAHFADSFFLIMLLFGSYIAFKLDIFVAACSVAIAYSVVSFPSVSQWHQQLGIYEGAVQLILRKTLMAVLPAMFVYSIVVPLSYLVRRN